MNKEKIENINRAMEIIFDTLNGSSSDVDKIMNDYIIKQHRTLQADFFRMFKEMCKHYVESSEKYGFDLRNKGAVELAKLIKDKAPAIPYI